MTPEDIDEARFTSVRRGGYEITEVDRFLAEARAALVARDGRMTQDNVREARFTLVKRGGYDTQQVDNFLDDLMGALGNVAVRSGPAGTVGAESAADVRPQAPQPAPPMGSPIIAGAAADDADLTGPLGEPRDAEPAPAEPAPAEPAPAEPAARPESAAAPADDVEPGQAPDPDRAPEAAMVTQRQPSDAPGITAAQLRKITPPATDANGYRRSEIDDLLARVADTLELFERVEGDELELLRGSQFLQGRDGAPQLLTGDQVRTARFTVDSEGGYDPRGVDAAVKRLARALDHHWRS